MNVAILFKLIYFIYIITLIYQHNKITKVINAQLQ